MKSIWNFVLTGGPCGGKTTCISKIEDSLTELGYGVLIVPETPTELIKSGIKPFGNSLDLMDFQRMVIQSQLNKENLYSHAAQLIKQQKVVIICDRGIIDAKAYISKEQFNLLLREFGTDEVSARDRYDAVFHLVTAADGAEEYYTLSNNSTRTETPEQARQKDRRTMSAWIGHPHMRVVGNNVNFDAKVKRVMAEIYSVLGEPIPLEIERKYLIERPNLDLLGKITHFTAVDIIQTYLLPDCAGTERRIRQRGSNGNFSYYLTEKRDAGNMTRIEVERKISEKEYLSYLIQADSTLKPIVKKRICFVWKGQYFEIDLYPFSEDKAILEIELTQINDIVQLPDFIKVIEEVTDNPNYRNHNLAMSHTL